jgi:MerR family transcriptional regulator, thiopeptide resistance regulator
MGVVEGTTVGAAAAAVGTTVRALHHYDAIGLVRPSGRTAAGYRLYTEADLDRLRAVLVYRELDVPLEEVAVLLDADDAERDRVLVAQLALVRARIDRLQQVRAALEREVEAHVSGVRLSQEEKRELFGDSWTENEQEYAREAEERWGDTDAWQQSRRRTSRYGTADWEAIAAEAAAIEQRFVELMRAGEPADGDAARAVAEEHRQHVSRWFYDCPREMHAGLGRMYVADERFTATYEAKAPGLAQYVSTAVRANAGDL